MSDQKSLEKEQKQNEENKDNNENNNENINENNKENNNDGNKKIKENNSKELELKEIEKMPIKDSNNLLFEKISNSKELIMSKEKTDINFSSLYQDLRESEADAIRARVETYELKGFNAMEPTIKNKVEAKLEITSISSLLIEKNIVLIVQT